MSRDFLVVNTFFFFFLKNSLPNKYSYRISKSGWNKWINLFSRFTVKYYSPSLHYSLPIHTQKIIQQEKIKFSILETHSGFVCLWIFFLFFQQFLTSSVSLKQKGNFFETTYQYRLTWLKSDSIDIQCVYTTHHKNSRFEAPTCFSWISCPETINFTNIFLENDFYIFFKKIFCEPKKFKKFVSFINTDKKKSFNGCMIDN